MWGELPKSLAEKEKYPPARPSPDAEPCSDDRHLPGTRPYSPATRPGRGRFGGWTRLSRPQRRPITVQGRHPRVHNCPLCRITIQGMCRSRNLLIPFWHSLGNGEPSRFIVSLSFDLPNTHKFCLSLRTHPSSCPKLCIMKIMTLSVKMFRL